MNDYLKVTKRNVLRRSKIFIAVPFKFLGLAP